MKAKDCIERAVEINSYLTEFPPINATTPSTKQGRDKLLYILEFGIPIQWQKIMKMQDFNLSRGKIKDFFDFCERMERTLDNLGKFPKKEKTKGSNRHHSNEKQENKKNYMMTKSQNLIVWYTVQTRPMTQTNAEL